jgi:hypothetical protein
MMISLFALVVVSSLGSAQIMGPKIPSMRGIWNPVVGAGAAYDVQANNQKINMEVAVVGKEKIGNADGYWLEIHTQAMGTDVTMKNLLAGGEVKRMIIQQGASDPMELSTDVISMMPKAAPSKGPVKDIRDTAKLIGKESVTVPAGTFACDHYQDTDGGKTIDVWVSPDASPYGMVKMTAPNASAVLTKIIQDYQSKITKTPKRMM